MRQSIYKPKMYLLKEKNNCYNYIVISIISKSSFFHN